MPKRALKGVVATHAATDATMGNLVTSTHPDEPKNATTVIRAWAAAGLNPDDLPDVRTATDVFMAACRSVETPKRAAGAEQVVVNRVKLDSEVCVYQLTRLVRDTGVEEITHHESMTLRFTKRDEQITVVEMEDYASLQGLEADVRAHYARHPKDIPGPKIRNAVRTLIERIGGQNLRRKAGGLYFVPLTHRTHDAQGRPVDVDNQPVLDGLKAFFEAMWNGRGDFYTIPLQSADAHQEMVAKHFSLNVNKALEETRDAAIQRARQGKGRGVQQTLLTRLYNDRRKYVQQIETFEQLVSLEKSDITANLRDLDKALADLQKIAEEA